MGLRARLLWLVLLAILPACALLAYHAFELRNLAVGKARHEVERVLTTAVDQQSQLIFATRQLLNGLAQIPAVADAGQTQCADWLNRIMAAYPYYTNLGVAATDGDVECSALPLSEPVNIADQSYFRRALTNRDFGVGDYQVGRITGISAINFGFAVLNESGEPKAVIYAALNLSWLDRLIKEPDIESGVTLTAFDSHGRVLARVPDDAGWTGRTAHTEPLVRHILAEGGRGTLRGIGLDGTRQFNAFAPLSADSAATVHLNVGVPLATLLSNANRTVMVNIGWLLAIAALAMVAAWWGGQALVLQPVNALTRTTRRIRNGDFSARTGLVRGRGELGQLAQEFDAMACRLQQLTRALKTLGAGNRSLMLANSEQDLLDRMCRIFVDYGGYQAAWVAYADDEQPGGIRPVAQAGIEDGLAALGRSLTQLDHQESSDPTQRAIRSGQRQIVEHLAPALADDALRAEIRRRGYTAGVVLPLPVKGRFIGALSIYSVDANAFDQQELTLLEEAAGDLALGIEIIRTRLEYEQSQSAMQHMAFYDELTGLPNYTSLERHLQKRLESGTGGCGLLFIDLERFRDINNAFGFHRGDLLLQETAARLRRFAGEVEIIARLYGDAFVLVQTHADAPAATQLALRILEAFEQPFELVDLMINANACIGITLCPPDSREAGHLIRHADVAARHAKASGQPYAFYTQQTDVDTGRRLAIITELRRAIHNNELMLHYQPKVDMRTRRFHGAEALLRWTSATYGDLTPEEFIPIAEQSGLIQSLTRWVLSEAMHQAARWWAGGLCAPVAVNLSARDLDDLELFDKIEGLLVECDIRTSVIEFEVTESAIMHDSERAMETLNRLSQLGIRLFIDDFGTGYSSLSYLQRLPVNAVKIDKTFIGRMLKDDDSLSIVRAIIDLAHDMGLKVVAEGVEDEESWSRLVELKCDFAQGHFIGKAVAAQAFERWRRNRCGFPAARSGGYVG